MKKGTLIILGCGNSAGVPAITNWWGTCDPNNTKNRRTRASVAVVTEKSTLIVDTGPDFKSQFNRENLASVDGVFYTHAHADHVHGIDDLRTLQRMKKHTFPVFSNDETLTEIEKRFDFMFKATGNGFYPAVLEAHKIEAGGTLSVGDIEARIYAQDHGTTTTLGLRLGNVAYSTDMKDLGDDAIDTLRGIDTWVVDANSYHDRANIVHACIEDVIDLNARVGAKKIFLTHLPPMMDYATLVDELPDGYAPAYDGLRLDIEW